jgi:signal transduction histidine kinase
MSQSKGIGPLIKNRLFAGVNPQAIKISLLQNNFLSFKEGDIIFQTGDKSEYIYLIVDGEIKLKVHSIMNSSIVREKGKNDFFGHYELLDSIPRKSSAVANSDCVLYKISQKELLDLISRHNAIKDTISTEKDEYNFNIKNSSYQIFQTPAGIEEGTSNAPVPALNSEQLKDPPQEEIKETENTDNYVENNIQLPVPEVEESQLPDEKEISINDEDADFPGSGIFTAALNGDLSFNDEPAFEEVLPIEENPLHDELDSGIIEGNKEVIESVNSKYEGKLQKEEEPARNIEENETVERTQEVIESFRSASGTIMNSEEKSTRDLADADNVEDKREITETFRSDLDYKKLLFAVKKIYENVELDKTVRSIIEAMFTLFDSQLVRIFLFDKAKNELWSFPFMENADEVKKVKIGEGLVGCCARDDETINIINPEDDKRFNFQTDTVDNILIEDMLIFPVHDNNKLVALVQMINSGKNGFTREDEEILTILSPDISNAIEKNSRQHPLNESEGVNKFEQMTDFFIDDINTSLVLINHYSEFIRHKTEIKEIKQVSEFIMEQVHAVLTFSGILSDFVNGKKYIKGKSLELDTVLNNKLDMFAEYVESRHAKLFKKLEADLKVLVDPDKFYQACFQLIKILCDTMPEGGNIYIISKKEGNLVSIEFHNTGNVVENKIDNSDSFIKPGGEENPGLSFAIANKIIKDHNGEIKIGSESIEGTSFKILLPIHNVSED